MDLRITKLLSLLLLTGLMYLYGGMLFTASLQQFCWKNEVRNIIETHPDELIEISIPLSWLHDKTAPFQWTDENEEFSLNGKLYDVTRMETGQDSLNLFCRQDAEEDVIRNRISMLSSPSSPAESDAGNAFFLSLVKLMFYFPSIHKVTSPDLAIPAGYPDYHPGNLLRIAKEIPTPPPRFIS